MSTKLHDPTIQNSYLVSTKLPVHLFTQPALLEQIGHIRLPMFLKAFAQELKYEFDALYAEAETRRRLMVVTIHDAIARAARVKAFEDFITYAQRHKDVWFARADALAHWALESRDSIKETTAI